MTAHEPKIGVIITSPRRADDAVECLASIGNLRCDNRTVVMPVDEAGGAREKPEPEIIG